MGSCLGPTFSEYYMCYLENKVFEKYPSLKPRLYTRYVDDIFVVIDDLSDIDAIKDKFQGESVLQFTHEPEKDRKLAFLDCLVEHFGESYQTSVYIKETNAGDCLNFKSICPENYKIGVIKALLHRGYEISSTWEIFHTEIERIKQLLTDNNFPCKIIEEQISRFLSNKMTRTKPSETDDKEKVNLWFMNQMTSNYKNEENKLTKVIRTHVQPASENQVVKLNISNKAVRLCKLLIKNKTCLETDPAMQLHVIYRYTCNNDGCISTSHVGYTTCTLRERFRTHTQKGSIIKHLRDAHQRTRIPRD